MLLGCAEINTLFHKDEFCKQTGLERLRPLKTVTVSWPLAVCYNRNHAFTIQNFKELHGHCVDAWTHKELLSKFCGWEIYPGILQTCLLVSTVLMALLFLTNSAAFNSLEMINPKQHSAISYKRKGRWLVFSDNVLKERQRHYKVSQRP